jgi:hypothetical protein
MMDEPSLFTDKAAANALTAGISLEGVMAALGNGHFKQPGYVVGVFTHFVSVDGQPLKVITAPHNLAPATRAIVSVTQLTVSGPRGIVAGDDAR